MSWWSIEIGVGEFLGPCRKFSPSTRVPTTETVDFRLVSRPPAWHCACPLGGRTMLRTAPLLIVMILAGGPVGLLGCELWCASPAAEDHHRSVRCHDASPTLPPGQRIASTAGCHDAAAIPPFVTEARQTESARVAATVAHVDSSSIGPGNAETTAGWCVFNVQPSHPPASRAVLRV
jgi:hypothetical protein